MAPMALDELRSPKRNSTVADFDLPPAKRQNLHQIRHHKLRWSPEGYIKRQACPQDEESVQALLSRSIALALEAVGFAGADPLALEAFRAEAEEYMLHFLATVRQSMLACRRTQPISQDFLQSLHLHQLSLRSLLPHLSPTVPSSKSQISLLLDDAATDSQQAQGPASVFGQNAASKLNSISYVPKGIPAFPSEHTYKATPDIPTRENDPKKMRERAIEEGRLGEAALRKLVRARNDDMAIPETQSSHKAKSMRSVRAEAWKDALQEATSTIAKTPVIDRNHTNIDDTGGSSDSRLKGSFGPVVNAGRKYWRKPGTTQTNGVT